MKIKLLIAMLVLAMGLGVQAWGVYLIVQGTPLPIMMLSWAVPIFMSGRYLAERFYDRR